MTTPEEQPTVGDFLARLEFKYDNDVLDFLKTGKGVVVVEDKIANIPLPKGAKGDKGDIGQLREGDVRYFNRRTDEAEAAAEASEASAVRSKTSETKAKTSETNAKTSETNAKASETKAKTSETNAKTSETNAKASETKAKTSETNAKTSETNAKASEGESTVQAELSRDAAALAITAAATVAQYVGDGFPEGKVAAPVGAVYADRLATSGAVRWIKTSGTGTTGWKVEYGDTGARLYGHDLLASGEIYLTRIGRVVHMEFRAAVFLNSPGQVSFPRLPIGFRGLSSSRFPLYVSAAGVSDVSVNLSTLGYMNVYSTSEGVAYSGETSYTTNDPWPTALPGTPS